MTDLEVLIKDVGETGLQNYRRTKRAIIALFCFLVITTSVFSATVYHLATSNQELINILNRRSPVLEYMRCMDEADGRIHAIKAKRDRQQTAYLFSLIDGGSDPSEEQTEVIRVNRDLYTLSEEELVATSESAGSNCVAVGVGG